MQTSCFETEDPLQVSYIGYNKTSGLLNTGTTLMKHEGLE